MGWAQALVHSCGCTLRGGIPPKHKRRPQTAMTPPHPTPHPPTSPQDFELACTPLQFWCRFLSNGSDFMVGLVGRVCRLCSVLVERVACPHRWDARAAGLRNRAHQRASGLCFLWRHARQPGRCSTMRRVACSLAAPLSLLSGALPRVTGRQRDPAGQVDTALQGAAQPALACVCGQAPCGVQHPAACKRRGVAQAL